MPDFYEEIEQLTRKLIGISSINSTTGENDISDFIAEYFSHIPYFQKHREYIQVLPLKNDPIHRKNVVVRLKGEKSESSRTLFFHGHTDTVGVDDFGVLKEYAFNCDELAKQMQRMSIPEEVRKDLESGEYMFGRGSCDMKSGDAVFMVLLRYLSECCRQFSGHIIASFNPVEENSHRGMIGMADYLLELKEREGLQFLFAVNNDYTCPMYPGDPHHYVYTGATGKLLPCFYVIGKETHVGQCFEGFDASSVAAELVKMVNTNPFFCNAYKKEYTLPPSVLHMRDRKDFYNVQTAKEAFVYFNYFIHDESIEKVTEKLVSAAKTAQKDVLDRYNEHYEKYCNMENIQFQKIKYPILVFTYEELMEKAKEQEDFQSIENKIKVLIQKEIEKGTDNREISCRICEFLAAAVNIPSPAIIIFYSSPYCPHNTLKKDSAEESRLVSQIAELINQFGQDYHLSYKVMQFYPSLSDSSYLKIDDSESSLTSLVKNFPGFDQLYPIPLDKIHQLQIPALDYGTYGKDAHKWSERVHKPYTFHILPQMILRTVEKFLG